MRFVFNERKAAQAAAQLLLMHTGHSMDLYRLLKLLYIADRRSLVETGYAITGDTMVSMRFGTVLSSVYDAIKDSRKFPTWSEYIGRGNENSVVLLEAEPEAGELSRYEVGLLREVHSEFGNYSFNDLRDFTHELPEWRDPGNSSSPIAPEEILRSAGRSEEEIQRVAASAEAHWRTARALARAHR